MNRRWGLWGLLLIGVLTGCGNSSSTSSGTGALSPFRIDLNLVNSVSRSQQAIFQQAAARWGQVITVGLPGFTISGNTNVCNGISAYNGPVDSVRIDITVEPIDGVGGTLGSSGPCLIRKSSGLPAYGVITLDSADVNNLEAQGSLLATVTHEMAHVLGFGTLWNDTRTLATGVGNGASCGSNPQFVGSNALREWQALGGSGGVPLENTGGLGTCDSHWQKSVFGDELMTGFIGGENPLSRVTLGSMADLGYSVDYNAADPYSLPAAASVQSLGRPLKAGLIFPSGTVDDR